MTGRGSDPGRSEYADIVTTETTSAHLLTTIGRGLVDLHNEDVDCLTPS